MHDTFMSLSHPFKKINLTASLHWVKGILQDLALRFVLVEKMLSFIHISQEYIFSVSLSQSFSV